MNESIVLLLLVFVVSGVCTFFRVILFEISAQRVVARLRKMLFSAIVRQEIGFFDASKTGELLNRLSSDVEVIQNTVTINISVGLRSMSTISVSIVILFYLSWKLTLLILLIVPLLIITAVVYGRYIRNLSKKKRDALALANNVAEECLSSIRTVRSFSAESFEFVNYAARVDESYYIGRKVAVLFGILAGGIMILSSFAISAGMWYGGYLARNDNLSIGTLSSYCMYTLMVAGSLAVLASLYSDVMKSVGASSRVFELLDRQPLILNKPEEDEKQDESVLKQDDKMLDIELDNISFSYPSRPDIQVLENFSLKIPAGKRVALVGQSGSGKSTIASLIMRLYDPDGGVVRVGGRDIRDIDQAEYRRHMVGIVNQEPTLFARTISENIAFGVSPDDYAPEDILYAAETANVRTFVQNFPDGFDTLVGERGIQLSGGQKQRVAIARVVLRNPSIILLDEATSALDSESESLVQSSLEELSRNRTTLIIAHRLSTVRSADFVVVLNQGKIVQSGSHADLLSDENGAFYELVRKQLS